MNWDPFQREVLAELGHVLYRATGIDAMAGPAPAAGAATATPTSPDAAMLARLARAAGVAVEALPAGLQEAATLARLRGDGQAKRALWPRLRALRARAR